MEIALREMAESSDASGAQALRREREEKIAEAQGAEKAAEDELGRAKEAFEAELAVFNEMQPYEGAEEDTHRHHHLLYFYLNYCLSN